MRYYLKDPEQNSITGPFDLDEIEARLKSGELSADALATVDTGESPAHATGWLCVRQLPGIGRNPPMPGLEAQGLPTSPNPSQKPTGGVADGETYCHICSAHVVPGETLCRKCAEHTARAEKKSAAPHRSIGLFIQVPGGLLVHCVSFIFVCAMCAVLGGGYRTPSGMLVLVLVAMVHCVAWIAYAIRLIRNPAERGFGFGIFIGVCLTGLLTGTCALSK